MKGFGGKMIYYAGCHECHTGQLCKFAVQKTKNKTRNSSLSSDGDFIVSNHGQLIQMEKTVSWVAPMRKMKGWW